MENSIDALDRFDKSFFWPDLNYCPKAPNRRQVNKKIKRKRLPTIITLGPIKLDY